MTVISRDPGLKTMDFFHIILCLIFLYITSEQKFYPYWKNSFAIHPVTESFKPNVLRTT